MPQGLYLYCLARLDRLPPSPLLGQGLDGRDSLAVAIFQDLAAVWSPVPVEDFCGPEAEERLRDLTWIGPRVIRHQEVVAGLMRHSPVLPARFGTIFASLANLEKMLQRHHDSIAGFLEAPHGPGGMGRQRAVGPARGPRRSCSPSTWPGRRQASRPYRRGSGILRSNGSGPQLNRNCQQWLQKVCREVWADLRDCAADARERRLLSREVTGSDQDMVWNWALLVPEKAVPDFQARLRDANARYAGHGLALECTGPWPPYSFTPALDMEPEP